MLRNLPFHFPVSQSQTYIPKDLQKKNKRNVSIVSLKIKKNQSFAMDVAKLTIISKVRYLQKEKERNVSIVSLKIKKNQSFATDVAKLTIPFKIPIPTKRKKKKH